MRPPPLQIGCRAARLQRQHEERHRLVLLERADQVALLTAERSETDKDLLAERARADEALAAFNRSIWPGVSSSVRAAISCLSCSTLVALAIGAEIPGCAMVHASVTVASAAPVSAATSSSAVGITFSRSMRAPTNHVRSRTSPRSRWAGLATTSSSMS